MRYGAELVLCRSKSWAYNIYVTQPELENWSWSGSTHDMYNPKRHLSYIINTMIVDILATQEARVSAAVVWTYLSWHIRALPS